MGVNNSWRQPVTMNDWMRDIEKRLMHEERRPQNASVFDVVGSGIGTYSRLVEDWNSEGPVVDGFFYSVAASVINSPDDSKNWMGIVQATSVGRGIQRVWEYIESATSPSPDPGLFTRSFVTNPDGTRNYTPWLQGGGGGSTAGITVQDEGSTIATTTQLDFIGAGVSAIAGTGEVQLIIDGTPRGAAGGDLLGSTYPNPVIAPSAITSAKIADGTIQAGDLAPGVVGGLMLGFPTPLLTWLGVHNLNQTPVDVTLVNTAGEEFAGTVVFPNPNQVQATFQIAVSGTMLIQR